MATITCPRCGATSEGGEIENGEYQWEYGDEMVLRCREIQDRLQAGETSVPVDCSEMDKAAQAFVDKERMSKSVQAAAALLAKTMQPALAKNQAALAKTIQNASLSWSRPQPTLQKTKSPQQLERDTGRKMTYAGQITMSPNWFREANKLLAAAEFLVPAILQWWEDMREWSKKKGHEFPEHEFQTTYMMLCSYAIENLCKGWLAARLPGWERERLRREGRLPQSLHGHKLFELVERIRMPLADHDEELLRRLALSAVWRGRYPVPADYLGGEEQFKDGKRYNVQPLSASDIPRIKDLIQRLRRYVGAPLTYRVSRAQT